MNLEEMKKAVLGSGDWRFRKTYTANYGWISENGTFIQSDTHVCHAGLCRKPNKPIVAVVSEVMVSQLKPELQEKYYHWMLNESPMSIAFLSKDAKEVLDGKLVFLGVDQPENILLAACIMHRHIWEIPSIPDVWNELIGAGMDKDAAFVVANCVSFNGATLEVWPRFVNVNHTLFCEVPPTVEVLRNFVEHKFIGVSNTPYKSGGLEHNSVYGIFCTKKPVPEKPLMACLKAQLDLKLSPQQEKRQQNNPFPAGGLKCKHINKYNKEAAIKCLVDYIPTLLEENDEKR